MTKKSTKTSVKSKKTKSSSSVKIQDEVPQNLPLISEEENETLPQISISIESYQYIQSIYPSSIMFTTCTFSDKELGKSEPLLLTDNPVNLIDHKFKFRCNTDLPAEIDRLASSPVLIAVYETPCSNSESQLFQSQISIEEKTQKSEESSIESAVSLYEALTGDVVEEVAIIPSSKKHKASTEKIHKKGKKTSEGKLSKSSSKSSKKSANKKSKKKVGKEGSKESGLVPQEILIGHCVIDLLPLLLGKSSFTEFIPMILAETFCDDRMIPHKFKPGLVVTVTIDKPIKFHCDPKILHVSLESIFNIPSILKEDMEYEICMLLPLVDANKQAFLAKNGHYTMELQQSESKYWPYLPKTKFNQTHYALDKNIDSIRNCVDNVDLKKTLHEEKPRIDFNYLKRNILSKDGFYAFYDYVRKYQKLVVEIYAYKKQEILASSSQKLKTMHGKSDLDKSRNYLHLMAIVDLSPLLYPGATKIRLAVPITTFHDEEAACAGLEKSYFFPPVVESSQVTLHSVSKSEASKGKNKKNKKGDKGSKSGKKSKSSSSVSKSKASKGKKNKNKKDSKSAKKSKSSSSTKMSKKSKEKLHNKSDLNMKNDLPEAPIPKPPPVPSVKVYNEQGERTFIVLEIELTEPLIKKENIEDLHRKMKELLHQKPFVPKIVLDTMVLKEYYKNVMKAIIIDINEKYATYLNKKKKCHCEDKANFLTYLRRIGAYQNFVSALIQVAVLLSQNRLNMIDETNNQQHYQKLVEELFIQLNSEINQVLHRSLVRQNTVKLSKNTVESLVFYAKEAVEMGNLPLAERYYLETLYHDCQSADSWYKYAVYKMESNEIEKASMCLQEALKRQMFHKNSLLMNAILLAEKKELKEAEMCLLTVMVQEPRWVEGWAVLYLFYKLVNNVGGMDLAQEMALKYLEKPYTCNNEDLVWSPSICPNTIFFRAASSFINMRLYSWAEDALSYELKAPGVVHYLLAVICYYKKHFQHAVQHLEKAKQFHGLDFSVATLLGHCFVALGDFKEANYYYRYTLESYEKPDYNHLLYMNCAKTTENLQDAKKLFLIACKNSPTPFTWMCCGSVYYKLNDLITAEECFSEVIVLDNTISESWGYLTLINLKLRRRSEAETCYNLALKNNLRDDFLFAEIRQEFEKQVVNLLNK